MDRQTSTTCDSAEARDAARHFVLTRLKRVGGTSLLAELLELFSRNSATEQARVRAAVNALCDEGRVRYMGQCIRLIEQNERKS